MKNEKISSLHDDFLIPKAGEDLDGYKDINAIRNSSEQFNSRQEVVAARIEQFGFDIKDVEDKMGKKITELTWTEYTALASEAIKSHYDVVVASVFDEHLCRGAKGADEKERMDKLLKMTKIYEKMGVECGVNLIKSKNDFKEQGNLVLGLEGGAHLIKSVGDVRKMAAGGIKLFGLQYGGDNSISGANGLTELGQEVVKDLFKNNLIVDLAHSGFKTRKMVMEIAGEMDKGNLVAYTHGCTEEDMNDYWKSKVSERFLYKEEVKKMIKMGSIIGIGVTKPFFDNTRKVAERINDTAQLDGGIDKIAIGTDFGGIEAEWINEIKSAEDFTILADMLSKDFNMDDESIRKVLRTNVKEWIKKAID